MIKAVCFDLDGVLVDACDLHKQALESAMLSTVGYKISEEDHKTKFNGLPTKRKLSLLGISEENIELIDSVKQAITLFKIKNDIKYDPTKVEIFKYLDDNKLDYTVVTNSSLDSTISLLHSIGVWYFTPRIITNRDVKDPKPSAEGYLKAFYQMKVSPMEVLIVEDSDHGIAAAKASGAHILVVNNATEVTVDTIKQAIQNVNNIS